MEYQELIDTIELVGFKPKVYSGRGMYGKECLSIISANTDNVILNIISEALGKVNCGNSISVSDVQDLCEMLKGSKIDSMGKNKVIYWPNIPWEETDHDSTYFEAEE